MTPNTAKLAFPVQLQRHLSPRLIADLARTLQASGVVDELLSFDALVSLIPRALWTPDVVPAAREYPDGDSYHDAFVLASIAAAASDLDLCVLTDAMRRGPWLLQTMLSLAGTSPGRVSLALGAGEARHGEPFGYTRSEGLGRFKDLLAIWRRLLDAKQPIDFDGRFWKLRNTYLGAARLATPRLLALGAGPLLLAAAIRDADGLITYAPGAWHSPEQAAHQITELRSRLHEQGRDAAGFSIGIAVGLLIVDDEREIETAIRNPLLRFYCAIMGRLHMPDWDREGLSSPFPHDWHYAQHLHPLSMSRAECDRIVDRVSDEMVRKSLVVGTREQVAAELQRYADAGAGWLCPFDIGGFISPDPSAAVTRVLDVCALLKRRWRGA